MKRSSITIIVIATVLFVAGVALFVGAFIAGGGNFIEITGEFEVIKKNFKYTPGESLYVKTDVGNLTVGLSPDNNVYITYHDSEYYKYDFVHESNDIRLIGGGIRRPWYEYIRFNISFADNDAEILLPKDFNGSITLQTATGRVEINDFAFLESVSLTTTTGAISTSNISSKKFVVKCTTGSVSAANITVAGNFTASTTTGRLKLEQLNVSGEVTCSNTTGGIYAGYVKCEKTSMKTTTGSIKFDLIDSKELYLSAATGSITGTLAGSTEMYKIISSTDVGKNSLPNNWGTGERSLNVSTSTGKIAIDFAG